MVNRLTIMESKYFLKVGENIIEVKKITYNNIKAFLEEFKYSFECNQRFVYNEKSYPLCSEKGDLPTPYAEYSLEMKYEVFWMIIRSMIANFK